MDQPESQSTSGEFERIAQDFGRDYTRVVRQIGQVIVGMRSVVDEVMACLLAGGHVLLEGVPGLGKTLLVRVLAQSLELSFGRIQFTPDLMPSDIIGTNIIETDESGQRSFHFQRGPVFGNLILADEINRATPKTQSAVLEAMQEHAVTVARKRHVLPEPFMVLATQNPLEMEGTYPLPEAQLDRFLFKTLVGSPERDELVGILDRTTGTAAPTVQPVITGQRVLQMQQAVRGVLVASHIKQYIASLVLATHPRQPSSPPEAKKFVRYGASPRGGQAILLAAKVLALRDGRANVSLEDVQAAAAPALRHRLILSFEGQAEGIDADAVIAKVLAAVSA